MIVLYRKRKGRELYFTGKYTEIGSPRVSRNVMNALDFEDRAVAYVYASKAHRFDSWRVGER